MTEAEAEIRAKVEAYVRDHFDGQFLYCFRSYDGDEDGEIDLKAVKEFFIDAGVADSMWKASLIAHRVMAVADKNGNGRLSLEELQAAIEGK